MDQSDPLVQSFPQLNEVNEIHLNLELAEQYIQLGAFEAAREILVETRTKLLYGTTSASRTVTESHSILSHFVLN